MIKSYLSYFLTIVVLFTLGYVGLNTFDLSGLLGPTATPLENPATTNVSVSAPPTSDTGQIAIASFNIQVFGEDKSSKTEVMSALATIVRQFDVVAIQEIRAKNQSIIPNFVAMINQKGTENERQYDYLIGPRQGRSTSKEQYVFIYDTASIGILDNGFVVPDEEDKLHRPPVVTRFAARTMTPGTEFTFALVNTHTDPDEAQEEVDALADVLKFVRSTLPNEDDVILLGDLNADGTMFGKFKEGGFGWAIEGTPTNVAGTKTYDNIIFDAQKTNEFLGQSGVFDFQKEFNLTKTQAIAISDHFPVWALFKSTESIPEMAQNPDQSPVR